MFSYAKHFVKETIFNINIEYDIGKYLEEMIPSASDKLKFWKRGYTILTHKVDGDCIPNIKEFGDIPPLDVLYNLMILFWIKPKTGGWRIG